MRTLISGAGARNVFYPSEPFVDIPHERNWASTQRGMKGARIRFAQVGRFSYRFDRLPNRRVMYTAANQLSAWSLLYHIPGVPHKAR